MVSHCYGLANFSPWVSGFTLKLSSFEMCHKLHVWPLRLGFGYFIQNSYFLGF